MSEHDQLITMINDLEARSQKLSVREIKFVDSIVVQLAAGCSPTINQAAAVHILWECTK